MDVNFVNNLMSLFFLSLAEEMRDEKSNYAGAGVARLMKDQL